MLSAIGIPLLLKGQIFERCDVMLKAAFLYHVPLYAYDISNISSYLQTGTIRALFWDGGKYSESLIDLPKYTEIIGGTEYLKRNYPTEYQWLMENTILTDQFGLRKADFQRRLLFSPLTQYAIPTVQVRSFTELVTSAVMFPNSVLKPSGTRRGFGIMKIENKNGKLFYLTSEGSGELTEEAFNQYYSSEWFDVHERLLLLEPCLNILDDDGRAVDFRCLVSLNGEGKWQNVLTYARIGGSGVASNVSHGGSVNFATEVLEQLLPGHGIEKYNEINQVALEIAAFVQKESPNTVSWLGLDICVDRPSNQIYVIEANSKPGTKIVGPWPLALVRTQYFKYLLGQSETV